MSFTDIGAGSTDAGRERRSPRRSRQVKVRLSDQKAAELDRYFEAQGRSRQEGLEAVIDELLSKPAAPTEELPLTGS